MGGSYFFFERRAGGALAALLSDTNALGTRMARECYRRGDMSLK